MFTLRPNLLPGIAGKIRCRFFTLLELKSVILCLSCVQGLLPRCMGLLNPRTELNQCLTVGSNHLSSPAIDLLDLGPSASQSSDGDASAASRILVVSFLQVCLFWATDLKCSRSFRLVSCSLSSDTRVRSLLRTTGSVVKLWLWGCLNTILHLFREFDPLSLLHFFFLTLTPPPPHTHTHTTNL